MFFSFDYVIKVGKRCSCATMELWMHLAGLLSTQNASITPWLHAAHLPFLNCFTGRRFVKIKGSKRSNKPCIFVEEEPINS